MFKLLTDLNGSIAGQLTLRKMAIVSNINLARVGARLGILAYHALPLDADSWHPPGLSETLPIKVRPYRPHGLLRTTRLLCYASSQQSNNQSVFEARGSEDSAVMTLTAAEYEVNISIVKHWQFLLPAWP